MNWFWKRKAKSIRKIEKNLGKSLEEVGETIYPDSEAIEVCKNVIERYNMSSETSLEVASEDLMFLFVLHNNSLEVAYKAYLTTGWNGRNIIDKLITAKYQRWNNISNILDFASGFGRISRHLISEVGKENIWVSDIKKESVDWQKKHLEVKGILSEEDPNDFKPPVLFDIIFVGSLFTHLPERLFKDWLKRLTELLTDNGTLIISTFDINVHGKEYATEFKYLEMSEDKLFNSLPSSIKGDDTYGITYTTPEYINLLLHELGIEQDQFQRHPLAFGKIQDIYFIHKQKVNMPEVDFSSYP